MRNIALLSFCIFACFMFSHAQATDELAVRKLLSKQATEWNKGNLNSFMDTYWKNDSLMFISKSGPTYGWFQTLENYKKSYPDTVSMGKLQFELLQVKRLSDLYFFVVGKWHLTRSIGNLGGSFTLLLRKINNQWVIIADHSS